MSKSKRVTSVVSTASALAVFAISGAACADDHDDKAYERQASDTQTVQSTMEKHKTVIEIRQEEARQMASAFGVSELNDLEDWKITHGGQELGEIDRLGVDRKTGELLAVVGLEGVTGVNMKEVAVPLNKLKKAGEETLSTNLTKDELQAKRDIDPWDGTYSQVLKESLTQ